MCLSALCFTVVELVGEHMVSNISPYQVVWTRYAVHLVFMLLVLGPVYKTRLVKTGRLKIQILRSMTMLAMPVCFILASATMPTHDIWAVYWSSPLVALALSAWVLRESADWRHWLVALVGLGGMLLIFQPDRAVLALAALLAFGMGVAISLHLTLSRVLRHDHPVTSLFHTALWVFLALSFMMPSVWRTPSLTSLVGMIIIGLVGALGLFALARAGELSPLPVVASFAYSESIWTLTLNAILFGVIPGKVVLLGLLVIIGVTAYSLVHEIRHA